MHPDSLLQPATWRIVGLLDAGNCILLHFCLQLCHPCLSKSWIGMPTHKWQKRKVIGEYNSSKNFDTVEDFHSSKRLFTKISLCCLQFEKRCQMWRWLFKCSQTNATLCFVIIGCSLVSSQLLALRCKNRTGRAERNVMLPRASYPRDKRRKNKLSQG